jgi:hypothetical protein
MRIEHSTEKKRPEKCYAQYDKRFALKGKCLGVKVLLFLPAQT